MHCDFCDDIGLAWDVWASKYVDCPICLERDDLARPLPEVGDSSTTDKPPRKTEAPQTI